MPGLDWIGLLDPQLLSGKSENWWWLSENPERSEPGGRFGKCQHLVIVKIMRVDGIFQWKKESQRNAFRLE